MCGQDCVLFIDWMLECKSLLGYIIFFSTEKYENNDSVILKYFQQLDTGNFLCGYIMKRW